MNLHLPLDFESLPEYRALVATQAGHRQKALFLFIRLWIELGHHAQVPHRLGFLPAQGTPLYMNSVDIGEPMTHLLAAGVVKVEGDGYFCERFARMNPHLAADFQSPQVIGNRVSQHVRRSARLQAQSAQQAMLIQEDLYRSREGDPLTPERRVNATYVVSAIDSCFNRPTRPTHEFSEGLIADADAVHQTYGARFEDFCRWLISIGREHPSVPKTTEQVLSGFPLVMAQMNGRR